MAEVTILELPELAATPDGADMIEIVDDVGVTPTSKKITAGNMRGGLAASGANSDITSIAGLTTALTVPQGGLGVKTLADGGIVIGNADGDVEVVPAAATTHMLVGGGASTKPVFVEATGTGAPVRATNPVLVGPNIGAATLGGIMTVGENPIQLDATLSADGKYSGITCDIVIGYASAATGDLVYLSNTDNRWEKTDANAEGTSGDVMLGIVISAGSSDGDAGVVMLQGFLKLTAWDFPLGGDALYVSETAGAMTATRPTTASTIVRVVGYAGVDADTVYFNPSGTWIETAA